MKSKIVVILCFFIVLSCQKNVEKINCDTVEEILKDDQLHRKNRGITSTYFFVLDSLIKGRGYENGLDDLSLISHNETIRLRENAKEINKVRPKPNQKLVDSLHHLQLKMDYINTKKVINLINTVGFPYIDTFNLGCLKESYFIFVHTPDELKGDVKDIVESGKKYISEERYKHIMWHLNGRIKHD